MGFPKIGTMFHAELLVRHLESGTLVFNCRSHAAGAESVPVGREGGVKVMWEFAANLGRGHYAIVVQLLNEHYRWVASSAPALLTVNERQSDKAIVYLDAVCKMVPLQDQDIDGRREVGSI
jgi:hypothetical protein